MGMEYVQILKLFLDIAEKNGELKKFEYRKSIVRSVRDNYYYDRRDKYLDGKIPNRFREMVKQEKDKQFEMLANDYVYIGIYMMNSDVRIRNVTKEKYHGYKYDEAVFKQYVNDIIFHPETNSSWVWNESEYMKKKTPETFFEEQGF